MDPRNHPHSMGDGAPDWTDMSMFNGTHFDDPIAGADSPFGTSAFNDFTTLDSYGDSPMGLAMRTPSKSGVDAAAAPAAATAQNQHDAHMMAVNSADSSSQDSSSSDTSSQRKRKNASESPVSDPIESRALRPGQVKQETDAKPVLGNMQRMQNFDNTFAQPTRTLSSEQAIGQADVRIAKFDFNSAASSPIGAGDFNTAMSLDAQVNIPPASVVAQFHQDSPLQTINPGMFKLGSRDHSPSHNGMAFHSTSPNAIFSTPSSDSPDTFNNSNWNANLQNPSWTNDFSNQLTSPGAVTFTPSPATNGATPSARPRHNVVTRIGLSPLHIAPISTKSRVETQINVIMTLEKPPPGIEHLHLPLHTIAKSKLLAKEEYDQSKVLELHTMLVCSSAMHNPQLKEKARQRAAARNNEEIQRRAEQARDCADEEKNDVKNVDEADKPANGGEVRICNNCIQRERKRAGRKKTKREEEQQHWERFETERVEVFNSNEYLPFKPCDPAQFTQREAGLSGEADNYTPPDGALQATAAMRIACYCRHQSEKEGFQVIFTLKDQHGNVVAQQMSDSILITDDHKTHPQSYSTTMTGDGYYQSPATYAPNGLSTSGLPASHSMVDMTTHIQPFTSSRSAGNLQALAYGQQFNAHSHIHQLPSSGYTSQATSATMTPASLSRPGSPSSAGQSGPNKKRKSASFHRRVPSGLTMTPRVDTNQPPSNNVPSAMSMTSQFSPTNPAFSGPANQPFMAIPNHGHSAQFFGSGPPTPNDSGPFNFSQSQSDMSRMSNNQAYFSHPSSAVPSRASSPVLQHGRGNMAAYARQVPIHTPTNSLNARSAMFASPGPPGSAGNDATPTQYTLISKATPCEGPVTGGTEVAIFGEGFVLGVQVMFGEQGAPTTFLSPNALLAIAPPGRMGAVHLSVVPPSGSAPYPPPPSKPVYRYTQNNEEMMVMALKFLTQQQFGNSEGWQTYAQQSATNFLQSNIGRAGLQQGYPAGHRMAAEPTLLEELVVKIIDVGDVGESTRQPWYDMPSNSEATMLSLASALGMHRVAAALLARGANADVRDKGGYTPLMHAAIHGRAQIFQLLLSKGADPTVRSLTGCSAIDLVSADNLDEFVKILLNTRRRRNSRPTLHSRPSFGSTASSKLSWDIASASFYESEIDPSEKPLHSTAPSRRPSTHAAAVEEDTGVSDGTLSLPPPSFGSWCDALVSHLLHVPTHVRGTMPSFCFSPLRRLPNRRYLRSLVPGKPAHARAPSTLVVSPHEPQQPKLARHQKFWDVFSTSTSAQTCAPPPAYHDVFPDRLPSSPSSAVQVWSTVDAQRTCACDGARSTATPQFPLPQSKITVSAAPPPWVWMSLLVVGTSVLMHVLIPSIAMTMPARALESVRKESPTMLSV